MPLKNLEKRKAYMQKYRKEHREEYREYHRAYMEEYRIKNKEQILERRRRYRYKYVTAFRDMKTQVGCQICGYNVCGEALEFHHLFEKVFEVVPYMWFYHPELTGREMEKCILLCANHHREVINV